MKLFVHMTSHRIKIKLLLCAIGFLVTGAVQAAFQIQGPEEEYHHGRATNESFRRAVESEEPLDANDMSFLSNVEEKRTTNRSYYRLQLARPEAKIKDVSNNTPGITGTVANTSVEDDVFTVSLGWGYKWIKWATELELVVAESFGYQTSPILVVTAIPAGFTPSPNQIQLRSSVKHFALFWNWQYEIPTFFDFIPKSIHPYAQAGFGLGYKTVDDSTFTLGNQRRQTDTSRSGDLAGNLGLGVMYQVTGNFLIDIAYRYMQMGEFEFGPIEGFKLEANDLKTRGFFVGFVYQR